MPPLLDTSEPSSTTTLPPIIFDGEIRDREEQKSARPDVRVRGFDIFAAEFTRSLFKCGVCQRMYLITEAASRFSSPSWFETYSRNCQFISAYQPQALTKLDYALMLSVGHEMIRLAWLRSQLGHSDWPITAVLHSMSPAARIRYFVTSTLLERVANHDALVCPTVAARAAIRNIFYSVPEIARGTRRVSFETPVIPLGVDTASFVQHAKEDGRTALGLSCESTIALYFNRFSPADKCDLMPLLIAFTRSHTQRDVVLVLAGDDTQFHVAARLATAAAALGIAERVKVIPDPTREMKHKLFAAADIFLAPYDHLEDTFALAIAEAMAAGLPVIASDWNGNGELVEHGRTGLLIPCYLPPGSSPWETLTFYAGMAPETRLAMSTNIDIDLLGYAIRTLAESPDLRRDMGRNGQRKATAEYDWRRVIQQYGELWRELLERSSQQRESRVFAPLSMQNIFEHYPTRILTDADVIALSPEMTEQTRHTVSVACSSPPYSAAIMNEIIGLLERQGPTNISCILAALSSCHDLPYFDVERHLGRLLKFGVLRLHTGATSYVPCGGTVGSAHRAG